MRSVWLALTLAAAVAPSAATQQAPRVPRVFLGAGVEVLGFRDGSTVHPGLALVGGFQLATLAPRLGLRAVGAYYERTYSDQTRLALPRVWSLGAELTYGLGGRVLQPYLVGGFALSRLQTRSFDESGPGARARPTERHAGWRAGPAAPAGSCLGIRRGPVHALHERVGPATTHSSAHGGGAILTLGPGCAWNRWGGRRGARGGRCCTAAGDRGDPADLLR